MTARQPPLSKGLVFQRPALAQQLWRWFAGFDGPLAVGVALLVGLGLLVMYSAGFDHGTRFVDHGRNMLIASVIMVLVAQVPPSKMMAWALPIYAVGVLLLVAVALFGITKKGATRWVNL
ncbi:MAG: FtsW/RodA/SpoVE family cell cycle protein, partial [Burkholderiales bacterium]